MTMIRRNVKTAIIALLVSVIALGAGIAVAHDDGTEIRITAMRHESDGRIEFAVQERDGEGWGERILPQRRFFPASGREGRWLSSTPIIVGVVEEPEAPTADLVVTDFDWEAYSSEDAVVLVTAWATVTNNSGETLTAWSGEMECVDADGSIVAEDYVSALFLIDLAHGESLRVQFFDLLATDIPSECSVAFPGEVYLWVTEEASEAAHVLVTDFEWATSTDPDDGAINDVTASATITNISGETFDGWYAEMKCHDDGVIVADDWLWDATALDDGETVIIELTDIAPRGTPSECILRFRATVYLTIE